MTFDDILAQVLKLLKRQGRVSYSALKRRFDLDDDYLNDLKDELLYVHPVRDDEGRGLVWTGDQETSPPPPVPSTSAPPARPVSDHEREPLSYTPKHLAEKILTSRSALEGERKQVTVLFCDLANSTPIAERLGPEHMHTLLNRFFELALSAVHRYEGTINQFLGDGFMALFGAPLAHEDHARRAVLAALALQRTLQESHLGEPYGVECVFRMGLNSGLVVVGSIGDNLRMDYSAIGDTTNLAARLQAHAAPDDILISESATRLVQGAVRLEALAPVEVKGKTELVPLYKVIGTLPRRSPIASRSERTLTPFVGRERELATLEALFTQIASGQGQVVGIVSEAGGGKSRLLYEFRQRLVEKRVTYLEGRCLSYGSTIPYHPLIDVLRHNCGISETDSPEAIVEKVYFALQEIGMNPEESAPYLLQLLGVKEGTESLAVLTPEAIRTRTFDTLKQMSLKGSQQRPLIVEIEDLHWIDQPSEAYLSSLVESLTGASMLLLTTYRPGYRPPWLEKCYTTQIALRNLGPHDDVTVVRAVAKHQALPAHLERLVVHKAEGNPFFLEELTRAVTEHGDLQEEMAIPDTIQGVLMARIDRLPEQHKRLLQTASVLGRAFSPRLLEAMWEGTGSLQPLLAELKRLEFLYERTGADEPLCVFKHALTQEVAYESLLTTRRQRLHAAAGHALERLYPDGLVERSEALAHHFTLGEVWEKAFVYLARAGHKARQAYANQEAIAFYTHAIDVSGRIQPALDATQLFPVYEGRGLVWKLLTKYDEAIANFQQMRQLARTSGNPRQEGESLYQLAGAHHMKQSEEHLRFEEQCAQQAMHLAHQTGDQHILARSLASLGQVQQVQGDLQAADRYLGESLQISQREGYTDVFAPTLRILSAQAYWQGRFQRAIRFGQESITLFRDMHNASNELTGLAYLCLAAWSAGNYAQAFTVWREGMQKAQERDSKFIIGRLTNTQGWFHRELGALSRDDEALEDLTFELIEGQRLATDENGTVLIWTGDTASGQVVAPQPAQTTQSPAAQAQPAPQVEPLPSATSPPDAERRQLTVMFCDLVDSTKLSSQLDPEEWRDVVRAYQRVCTEVIQRYDGHIAQLLGDGLLIYFGYPQAHEDDAQRAVRSGLGILAATEDLHKELKRDKGITLAVRLGIHTGLAVVGAMGGGGRQEQLALGETPNVAARIQGLAAPNTLVISDATSRLVQGYFACQDLGVQTLRGVAESIAVYRVLSESGATSRLDVAQPRGLTPLVGRESEVTLLLERWAQVKSGQGQVILLTGDAGIGKSRLVQMLKDHVTHESHVRWECRTAEYYQNTALFPLTDLFQRLLRFHADATPDEKLGKLEHALSQYRLPLEESVPLLAPVLSLPLPENRYPLPNLSPQRQRQKTLETIVAILLELAERHPVLFILEDLHWTDPTTLELLNLLIEQTPTASMLVLLTCRPHFQPAWHHRSSLTVITVNRLSPTQVEQVVNRMIDGKTLPKEVLPQIIEKTDGVPLFVEEMTKAILESGQLKETDGHYKLAGSLQALVIPATLHDSLMARLDRLMTAKVIAQLGATIGRQFSYALLQAVAQLDEAMLQHELGRLVEAEIVYQRGVPPQATYIFKHALIQDAAYQSLLKSTRQQYHQRIAHVLEAQFPEIAETQPELVAHHCMEAGLNAQAVGYWQRGGQKAIQRSANVEAIAHLTKGLEQLHLLPDTTDRVLHELTLHRLLGVPLLATKGWAAPEVGQVYSRARALCQRVSDLEQIYPVLVGLWSFYLVKGELQTAQALAEQLLTVAQRQQDSALLAVGYFTLGDTLYWRGALVPARTALEQGLVLDEPQQHRDHAFRYGQDPGTSCLGYAACTLWLLGYPEQARRRSQEMLTRAQALSHTFSLAFAHNLAIRLSHFLREWHTVLEQTERLMALTSEQGFAQLFAACVREQGAAWAAQGKIAQGMTQMRQAMTYYRTTGAVIGVPLHLARLADVCGHVGEVEEGLRTLTEALTLIETTGERVYEAELYRVKGELLLQQNADNQAEAEACFQHAITIAQSQQAKSWELRASTSLARLWQQQGKRQEAHNLLAPVYGWFTEGFDTADLIEAKALLDELA